VEGGERSEPFTGETDHDQQSVGSQKCVMLQAAARWKAEFAAMQDKGFNSGLFNNGFNSSLKALRGGLVCKAHRILNHSTLDLRVKRKKKKKKQKKKCALLWQAAARWKAEFAATRGVEHAAALSLSLHIYV